MLTHTGNHHAVRVFLQQLVQISNDMLGLQLVTIGDSKGGGGAVRVTDREDVMPALRQAQEYDGAFLIEFVVDPSANVFPMVPPGGGLADTIEDPAVVGEA